MWSIRSVWHYLIFLSKQKIYSQDLFFHRKTSNTPVWSVTVYLPVTSSGEIWTLTRFQFTDFVTPWTVAHQAPPSMGFSRREDWSGLPYPSPKGNSSVNSMQPSFTPIWIKSSVPDVDRHMQWWLFICWDTFFFFVVNFVIHWNEKALGSHVFPIPIPPPTSLPPRSRQVLPEHQVRALVRHLF